MKQGIRITDFHSHILPCADHGSGSLATSQKQLKLLTDAGIDRVVATPHFYPSDTTVADFLARRIQCADALHKALDEPAPELIMGAEVLVCCGLDEMEGLEKLCIEGTDTILLEMPFGGWSEPLIETVGRIKRRGLYPVMAHIDRYEDKPIERFFELDIQCQVNASALTSRRNRGWLINLVKEGRICALGSDIHGADRACAKAFSRACALLGSELKPLMERTEMLLSGAKIFV